MATDKARTNNCPTCGGPLPPFAGAPANCPFCGAVVERPAAEKPPPRFVETYTVPAAPAARRRGCVNPVAILLAIVLLVGGVLFFLLLPGRGSAPGVIVSLSRSVWGQVIPVPADRPGPADLLVFTFDSKSSERYLTYLDGTRPAWMWDSPPVDISKVYRTGVVVRNQKVYLADGTRLWALDQGSGQVAWQASLSDSIISICEGCVRVAGGYVIALSQDGVLQAFEAESGRPAWSVRLNETPRNLWVVNDQVAVVDYEKPNDVYSIVFQLRDPATGEVVQAFAGYCQREYRRSYLRIYDPDVVLDPAGQSIYLLHGSIPGCIQRWNLATGALDWQVWAEDHSLDRFTAPPLLAGGRIYASYSGRVIAIDGEQGTVDLLLDEVDYELQLQGEQEGTLVVLAQRQRGSTRYELWGVNADSGHVRWRYIPQDEVPIEGPGSSSADKVLAWHLTREGLVVLHLNAEPPTLVVGTIDLRTGQETVLGTAGLDDDYWAGLSWSDTAAWLTIRKVYTIDLGSGKVVGTWP